MLTKRELLRSAALAALTVTTMTPAPASAQAKAEWPDIREAKAIAEEGFIYGLPIVMNYAVMYEYAVDKNSGQYKAPFNQINNEARVFTYKDTAIAGPCFRNAVFQALFGKTGITPSRMYLTINPLKVRMIGLTCS